MIDDEQARVENRNCHMNVTIVVAEIHANSSGIQEDSWKWKFDKNEQIFDDGDDDINVVVHAQDKNKTILSSDLAKQNKKEYLRLKRHINNLCEKAASGIVIDIAKLENLKLELSNFEIEKCKEAVLGAKAIWAVESDKNTKYFLNLEKYNQESNAIK
ncbi:unnamed protein product [Mytilus edulis]|uniref:Uncharacterized protein n=1 Tax=Mytilus edulis TaxID=6550 RepID=A0A8S3RBM1_MYTED|nr:unnamed protein product [Mytilus edulis]